MNAFSKGTLLPVLVTDGPHGRVGLIARTQAELRDVWRLLSKRSEMRIELMTPDDASLSYWDALYEPPVVQPDGRLVCWKWSTRSGAELLEWPL